MTAIRDALEVLFVVAVGAMAWSAIVRLRRGEIAVVRCGRCRRPTSDVYRRCPHCGAPRRCE